jgi:hypothetical protein
MTARALARAGSLLACALVLTACATGSEACRRDPITGSQQCQPASGDYTEAVGTAAAATAAWAAVGCTVNGCEPPFRCNGETKMCERIRCAEGKQSCPAGYSCDLADGVCK